MIRRGRKSTLNVVALDVNSTRPRLRPPKLLTKAEATLFIETATANPHLRLADTALLASFVQALAKTYRLARRSDADSVAACEKTARVMLSIATKLRITTQAQIRSEYAGRQRQHMQLPSYYETAETDDE